MAKPRDNFATTVVVAISRRAAFICSNPACRRLTLSPSESDPAQSIYVGVASHISAAAAGGPRYDPKSTPAQRSAIDNAIYLCTTCSVMIDKNGGSDFPVSLLLSWKEQHERYLIEQRFDRQQAAAHVNDELVPVFAWLSVCSEILSKLESPCPEPPGVNFREDSVNLRNLVTNLKCLLSEYNILPWGIGCTLQRHRFIAKNKLLELIADARRIVAS